MAALALCSGWCNVLFDYKKAAYKGRLFCVQKFQIRLGMVRRVDQKRHVLHGAPQATLSLPQVKRP